jgi:hypothetical protein
MGAVGGDRSTATRLGLDVNPFFNCRGQLSRLARLARLRVNSHLGRMDVVPKMRLEGQTKNDAKVK